jgi:hypothetical protein
MAHPNKVKDSLRERLHARLVAVETGCLEWSGYRDPGGYGQIGSGEGRRLVSTHVAAWIVACGPVPDGLWVLHRCDNPPCCNVAHLFLGTPQDNIDDMHAKGRARKAQGIAASHARLTAEQVAEIRRRWVPGERLGRGHRSGNTAELAVEFGISKQYVGQLGREVWRKHA